MRDRGAAWLLAGFVALGAFTATRSTLWDRDEARFGEAAAEMAADGNLLYPTFDGALRADKPILPYWAMAAGIRLLGRNAFAVRLASVLAAAAAAAATASAARRLLGPGAGLRAAAVLVSSPLFLLEASAATADAMLVAAVAAALLAFTRLTGGRPRLRDAAFLAASVAAAMLAKGPVGFLLPFLGIAATLLLAGDAIPERRRVAASSAVALAAGALLFAAWFVPADAATGGRYFEIGFGRHVVGRALRPMEGHGGSFALSLPYYLPVLLLGFSPWLLFLPGAASAAAGGRLGGRFGRALLAGWTVPAVVFFSVVATKLPHYVLPVFPALAIAVAGTIVPPPDPGGRDRRWLRRGAALFFPVAVVEAAALLFAASALPRPLRLPSGGLAVIVAGTSLLALAAHRRERFRQAAAILVSGAAAAVGFGAVAALPAVERFKPVPALIRNVDAAAPGVPAATYGFEEPSLDFCLARPPIERLRRPEDVLRWAKRPVPGVLVTTREAIRPVRPLPPLAEIAAARGFNFSKGSPIELVALLRRGR